MSECMINHEFWDFFPWYVRRAILFIVFFFMPFGKVGIEGSVFLEVRIEVSIFFAFTFSLLNSVQVLSNKSNSKLKSSSTKSNSEAFYWSSIFLLRMPLVPKWGLGLYVYCLVIWKIRIQSSICVQNCIFKILFVKDKDNQWFLSWAKLYIFHLLYLDDLKLSNCLIAWKV